MKTIPTEDEYKRDLELKLMFQNTLGLPVFFEDKKACVIFSPNTYSLESDEIVKEWIRKLRIDGLNRDTIMLGTSSHDAFICLFVLNSLRKMGSPNFLYYYGVMSNSSFYALSEYTFTSNYKKWKTFEDICQTQSYETILKYYLSILLSIYQANHICSYTHYSLTPSDIFMKPIEDKEYEAEYQFRGGNLYILNGSYIPLITNHHKTYANITIEGENKSFGVLYNRGFPITDAYSLLKHIIRILNECKSPVYNSFVNLSTFFEGISRGEEYFIPYYDNTQGPSLGDFIDFIIKKNEGIVSYKINKPLLRCMGVNLEIKHSIINYYSAKSLIQLYDLINFNLVDYNKEILQSSFKQFSSLYHKEAYSKELHRFEGFKSILNKHAIIYEIPDDIKLLRNNKYRDVLIKNMKSMIVYINEWEKVKTYTTIFQFLSEFGQDYNSIYGYYQNIIDANQGYYNTLINQLKNVKDKIQDDKDTYYLFLNEIILLENLD
jgi:hypothetical protein